MKKLEIRHYGNDFERRIHLYWTATPQCLCKFVVEEGRQDHGMRMGVAKRSGDRSATG
jgi:hypothetical protein